jgi:enoyl-CoA hydratase/carnithine racemase
MATTVPRRDRVLRCVISAADRGSTLDHDGMLRAMAAMQDPGPATGAILLAGGGANFCAGGDMGAFAAAGHSVGPALAAGLVAVVVPDGRLADEAGQLAARLAAGPTAALGRIKRLLRDGESRDLDSSLDAEAIAIAASAAGAEGREGVRAFRERRPPRFHDEPVSG